MTNQKHKSRVIFILLFGIFLLPGLMALFLYQTHYFHNLPKINHGQLLKPPVKIHLDITSDKWGLIFWQPSVSEENLSDMIEKIKRIRLALGRRYFQVQPVLLTKDKSLSKSAQKELTDNYFVHRVILADEMNLLSSQPAFYILSPEKYVIIRYSVDTASNHIFKDIKRLLKKGDE